MNKVHDYFKGFEGESELKIFQKNENEEIEVTMLIWIGYFNSIIEEIKPNKDGSWEGISLYYHTSTGWYDISPWRCEALQLFTMQLESINKNKLNIECQEILTILIDVFNESIYSSKHIYFEYW